MCSAGSVMRTCSSLRLINLKQNAACLQNLSSAFLSLQSLPFSPTINHLSFPIELSQPPTRSGILRVVNESVLHESFPMCRLRISSQSRFSQTFLLGPDDKELPPLPKQALKFPQGVNRRCVPCERGEKGSGRRLR